MTASKTRFDAEKVVALKSHVDSRRLEIRLVDERGRAHVVSLPIAAALELSSFITDACGFMKRLQQQSQSASKS